ncbi:unnamed protein product [Moneuplotes crassus]|uniref:Uncharacterized protein n=1 Tax=Euplotes crassus TaxID=5936 RepID=A0AAD1XMK1_EUPCR|nr:unnamed protein product [Moneuplotes crassus]
METRNLRKKPQHNFAEEFINLINEEMLTCNPAIMFLIGYNYFKFGKSHKRMSYLDLAKTIQKCTYNKQLSKENWNKIYRKLQEQDYLSEVLGLKWFKDKKQSFEENHKKLAPPKRRTRTPPSREVPQDKLKQPKLEENPGFGSYLATPFKRFFCSKETPDPPSTEIPTLAKINTEKTPKKVLKLTKVPKRSQKPTVNTPPKRRLSTLSPLAAQDLASPHSSYPTQHLSNPDSSFPTDCDPSKFTCPSCLTAFCLMCRDAWHPTQSCAQAEMKHAEEERVRDSLKNQSYMNTIDLN